jgi:hypothetical protein
MVYGGLSLTVFHYPSREYLSSGTDFLVDPIPICNRVPRLSKIPFRRTLRARRVPIANTTYIPPPTPRIVNIAGMHPLPAEINLHIGKESVEEPEIPSLSRLHRTNRQLYRLLSPLLSTIGLTIAHLNYNDYPTNVYFFLKRGARQHP